MTGKANSAWTILVLLTLGIGFLVLRYNLDLEAGDDVFRLTYTAAFHLRQPDGQVADARLRAAIPETTRFCKVGEHEVDAPQMEQVHSRIHTAERSKDIVLHTRKAGKIHCAISFRITLNLKGDWRLATPEAPLSAHERNMHLANARGMTASGPSDAANRARDMVRPLLDGKPGQEELADRIFQECQTSIDKTDVGADTGDETLLHQRGSPAGRAMAFATLCRAAGLPARLVTGFEIKKPEIKRPDNIKPRTWVEVYLADPKNQAVTRWVPYDPDNGAFHELDHDVVPVRRDGVELVRIPNNATDQEITYTLDTLPPPSRSPWGILDLRRLPGKLQEPIKIVLILPIGALFTALVRTVIGIRTFGTFSPTLLALAFVYNDWQSGLCIFFVVIATGFISRTFLDRLKLLLVPRLGIILTLVVMLMVLGIAVMNYYGGENWAPNGRTVLLPMVILTNLVERFYVTSEEDSFVYAVRLLITTALMALMIYMLLSSPGLGNLLFYYPELHFFTVVVLILIGRYTGYRLTELVRFRDLVHPSAGEPPQSDSQP